MNLIKSIQILSESEFRIALVSIRLLICYLCLSMLIPSLLYFIIILFLNTRSVAHSQIIEDLNLYCWYSRKIIERIHLILNAVIFDYELQINEEKTDVHFHKSRFIYSNTEIQLFFPFVSTHSFLFLFL